MVSTRASCRSESQSGHTKMLMVLLPAGDTAMLCRGLLRFSVGEPIGVESAGHMANAFVTMSRRQQQSLQNSTS